MRLRLVPSLVALGVAAPLFMGVAHAQLFNALSAAGAVAGNQPFTGNLGLNFTVNQQIAITDIGIFDAGNNGLNAGTTLQVGIYSLDGLGNGTLVGGTNATFTSATAGTFQRAGSYLFQHLTPVYLAPGNYSIMAVGYNATDMNYNTQGIPPSALTTNNGGGLVTFGDIRWSNSNSGTPNAGDFLLSGQSDRFGAFSFTYGLIPEPGTVSLLGMAALPLAVALRRRRK